MTAVVPSPKACSSAASSEKSSLSRSLCRTAAEASPLINASRTSSQRYCSAVTALKEQSFERVFRTCRNCCRDSPGSCRRVASRWRANTLFLVLTYTRFNSATAASYVSQSPIYWYAEGVRKLTRSPRRFTSTLGSIAACPVSAACKKDSNVAIQYLKTKAALESVGHTSKSFGCAAYPSFGELNCRALACEFY